MTPDWIAQEEVTVLDKPEYFFALEEFRRGEDQMVFLHLIVHEWKPSVFKELMKSWKSFREHVTCPLYVVAGVEDVEKWEAFVTLLGFKFLTQVVCENGKRRRLFIHLKEHPSVTQQPSRHADHTEPDDKPVVGASPLPDTGLSGRERRARNRAAKRGNAH